MDNERVSSFFTSFDAEEAQWLAEIREEALREDVPIIREETQRLLRFLVRTEKCGSILEIGTAVGFSALMMWEASGRQAKLTTIEKYDKRIAKAKENFRKAGAEGIQLLEGDAAELLPSITGEYDLVFMDAAKGQYPAFLADAIRLCRSGGLIITDNVLQDGDLLKSRYAVRRRDRTIHARMRDYLYTITHHEQLETLLLSGGDGVAVSRKK